MAEKSILEMTNEEILALIAHNDALRREATQEKMVSRVKEQTLKDGKVKAKVHTDAASEILKDFLKGAKPGSVTKEKAKDMAGEILKSYLTEQKGKPK
jgi:predicted polyphosphate/ATP-dependent NAD kinase